jgi:hypothetical protein
MADKDQVKAEITDSLGLAEAELAPTPTQEKAVAAGCMAIALSKLTNDQKTGLNSAVDGVEADLALAIDRIKKRRARMANQMDNLRARKSMIEGGSEQISALYTYAEPAIAACPEAAEAARLAKEGSDLVHARLNEVEYQMALIQATDLDLASDERELSRAMNSLDKMILSLR